MPLSAKQAAWRAAWSTFVALERVLPVGPLLILLAANLAALVRAATGALAWLCTLGASCLLVALADTLAPVSDTLVAGGVVAPVTDTLGVGRVSGPVDCTLGAGCLCATGGVTACWARRGEQRSSALAMSGDTTTLSMESEG